MSGASHRKVAGEPADWRSSPPVGARARLGSVGSRCFRSVSSQQHASLTPCGTHAHASASAASQMWSLPPPSPREPSPPPAASASGTDIARRAAPANWKAPQRGRRSACQNSDRIVSQPCSRKFEAEKKPCVPPSGSYARGCLMDRRSDPRHGQGPRRNPVAARSGDHAMPAEARGVHPRPILARNFPRSGLVSPNRQAVS